MSTLDVPSRPAPEHEPDADRLADQERQVRRVVAGLAGVLGVAALALLVALLVLLRPAASDAPDLVGEATGPVDVVRSLGVGDERLQQPLGVAFAPDGNVWVADTGQARVVVLTPKGDLVRILGLDGPGALVSPNGIAADPENDRMYVADWNGGAVRIFTPGGRYVGSLPATRARADAYGPDGFTPYDVAIVGRRVVAASNDGLYFFDRDGTLAGRWGTGSRTAELGGFNFPNGVAADPERGRVYVADTLNRRVLALDERGTLLWVSGTPDEGGQIRGFWQLPRSVEVGPDGNVYVTDTFRFDSRGIGIGHIVVLSPDGELLSEVGRTGRDEDSFSFPEKLVAGPDRTWALADREANRVALLRFGELPPPAPEEPQRYASSFGRPEGVSAAADLPGAAEPEGG